MRASSGSTPAASSPPASCVHASHLLRSLRHSATDRRVSRSQAARGACVDVVRTVVMCSTSWRSQVPERSGSSHTAAEQSGDRAARQCYEQARHQRHAERGRGGGQTLAG